ncbi:protein transport protein gos1 [Microsporum canis]|uniref:Golgi SNAP receptor complex member 1 n=1 Tax=Arthroderma otae (strain ATCC MYA-4605 / CBS 113480) TaxID=554155 RepID=C5FJW4_ARTOC|nr:protein transport protein GOS1 [Microsporum canis CBS 113480]EEQ30975.1 protein transport protein GOS1 [Microsporum canis CBS 113480]
MTTSTGTGWAQLRQQARSLETRTESLFHSYAQYASMSQLPAKPSEDENRLEAQIQDILSRRETLISQLSRLLDSESALTASALKQNNLSRHREVLLEHRQELKRLKATISETRDRVNLLSNVRSDIDAYRASNPSGAEADYMLEERGRLDSSHNMMDSVLSQAYAVNESFGLQRETLASINRRIVGAASQIPGVNNLINKIGAKRRRDGIILGTFIGICCLMVFFFR